MKRKALFLAAALAGLTAVASAQAGDLSYSYFEAGYLRADPDGFDSESGFGLRGSGALTDHWHVFGAYESIDVNSFDLTRSRIGLGYNTAISDNIDFYGRVSYVNYDFDSFGDENGWGAEVGIRGAVSPHFEASAGLRYENLDNDDDTSLVLGGQYKFNETWGIAADFEVADGGNTFFIGPRVSF
jgi:Ax21 family sulfation-dependent quorum factor